MAKLRVDEIGYWSELKLDIVREYASAYSRILSAQANLRGHVYVDAFAGAGVHLSKRTGEFVPGSPLNALNVEPPFSEYHFIDLDGGRAENLRHIAGDRSDVYVYEEDCNDVLCSRILPRTRYADFRRGLWLLDPYALNLDWSVIASAGRSRSVEIFLNFMVMDMNMNVLWRDPARVRPDQIVRMNRFWGDESWREAAYSTELNLFHVEEKTTNHAIAAAFKKRLKEVAGFKYVPDPMPMRNSSGATVYYLFFASQNMTGDKVVKDIFSKYRDRGVM